MFPLPPTFGPDGIWFSVLAAEVAAPILGATLTIWLGGHYRYLPERR